MPQKRLPCPGGITENQSCGENNPQPNRHYPLPIEKTFEILIEQRNYQTKLLEKARSQVKRDFNRRLGQKAKDSGNFILISKEKPIKSRAKKMLETAQEVLI